MKKSLANQIRQRMDRVVEQNSEEQAHTLLEIQSDLERFRKNPHIDRDTLSSFEENVEQRLSNIDDHVTVVQEEREMSSRTSKISRLLMTICPWMDDPSPIDGDRDESSSFGD
jgi:hypothetical protein